MKGCKYILTLILISFSIFFLSNCNGSKTIIPEEPEEPEQPALISRTILVYMAGENSLSYYTTLNLDSIVSGMNKVSDPIDFLVFEDKKNIKPNLWKIEKDEAGRTTKKLIKSYEEINTADKDNMTDIINEVFKMYPSKEKDLILWSHGTAWLPSNNYKISNSIAPRAFGQDGPSWMEIWDVREALDGVPYLDFLIFDACFMSSVEVAYELKDVAKYIVASPTEIMGLGFPYHTIVPLLNEENLDLQKVCEAYMRFYNGREYDGTVALIDCSYLDELARYYKILLSKSDFSALRSGDIQEYGRKTVVPFPSIFFDLENVVELVSPSTLNSFKSTLEKVVKYHGYTPLFISIEITRSCGMSVFVPELNSISIYNSAYKELKWYKATRY